MSSLCVGPEGQIIVADTRIVVYSSTGEFVRELGGVGGSRGRFSGVAVDEEGCILAARMEKAKSYIQVALPSKLSFPSSASLMFVCHLALFSLFYGS